MLAYTRERARASAYARIGQPCRARHYRARALRHAFGETRVWKGGALVDSPGQWELLGDGASAEVYGNGQTAVKLFKEPPPEMTSEQLAMQIVAEGAMMRELAGAVPEFQGIVSIEEGRVVGLAMEQYPATDLTRAGALTPEVQGSLLRVIKEVCRRVLCVDVKPENFVVRNGDVRMIDLGSDFCKSADSVDYEARVDVCVLTFCVFACNGPKTGAARAPTVLLDRLLDGGKPRPEVVARLKAVGDTPHGEGYWRNLATAPCVQQKFLVKIREKWGMEAGHGDFVSVLSSLAEKLGQGSSLGQ
jgi:hypothetical protein